MMNEPKPGIYRHFKGGIYEVLHIATHSETLEPMVVYRDVCDEDKIWVRPLSMWNETVTHNGITQERFTYLAPDMDTMDGQKSFPTIEAIVEIAEMYDRFSDDNIVAYYDRESGELLRVTQKVAAYLDGDVSDDELDEAEKELLDKAAGLREHAEKYIMLPRDGLIDEYEIMEDFASEIPGPLGEKLTDALQGKGAFRRFKDTVNRLKLTEHWYEYRDMRYRREVREWCETVGIDWRKGAKINLRENELN